jgi:DMSO/TMAO reductase YedYZ molybdopterin-dependent catalytic subunit
VVLLVVLGATAAGAGVLEARRPPAGRLLTVALAVGAAVAVLTRTGASPFDVVPALVAALAAVVVLGRLTRPLRESRSTGPSRRALLLGAGAWAGLGIVAAAGAEAMQAPARRAAAVIARIRLPRPVSRVPPLPAGAQLDVPDLAPLITPNSDFYRIDIALSPPQLDPATWVLHVTGEVERPLTLTYSDLAAMPTRESRTTIMCVSNEVGGDLIGSALWQGVPIRDVLALARPKAGADMVLSSGADGFSASTPLSALTDPGRESLLAIGMNGEVLPELHGFPVRMIVPGLYGFVSATKWLTRLEVTRFDEATAYWTTRGYSAKAPIKVGSRIDVPDRALSAGVVTVAGVAWAQHTGIERVQLQVDDGPWRDCELSTEVTPDLWRQWRFRWTATKGEHRLRVRATDRHGLVQTAKVQGVAPDGATGLHTVTLHVA